MKQGRVGIMSITLKNAWGGNLSNSLHNVRLVNVDNWMGMTVWREPTQWPLGHSLRFSHGLFLSRMTCAGPEFQCHKMASGSPPSTPSAAILCVLTRLATIQKLCCWICKGRWDGGGVGWEINGAWTEIGEGGGPVLATLPCDNTLIPSFSLTAMVSFLGYMSTKQVDIQGD